MTRRPTAAEWLEQVGADPSFELVAAVEADVMTKSEFRETLAHYQLLDRVERAATPARTTQLEAALAAARRRPIFPLQEHGKKPRIAKKDGGNGLHDATQDTERIRLWFGTQYPLANIGAPLLAGELVLDLDPRHGSDESLAKLRSEHGEAWLATRTHKTRSGGRQLFFKLPDGITAAELRGTTDLAGVDVRKLGNYVIWPGSVVSLRDLGLEGVGSYEVEHDVAPLVAPDWLIELLSGGSVNGPAPPLPDVIPEGAIDTTLTSLAGTMARRNATEAAIYAALVAMLKTCPPGHTHTEADCRRIAGSIFRAEQRKRSGGSGTPEWLGGDLPPQELEDDRPGGPVPLAWELLSEIEMRSIVFLDKPFWQAAAFHLVVGRKGVGKGTTLADLAARVTRGELGSRRRVVWIASEDSASIDIKPRVVAADGEPGRIHVVVDWLQLPRDIGRLGSTIAEIGEVGLVIIDPVGNHITGKDSSGDTDIRDAIAPLNDLADRQETMLVGIRHLTEKEVKAGALGAILGASAWVQVPRAVIGLARDDDDPTISHIQCLAGNRLPPDTPGRAFQIVAVKLPELENEVTRAHWLGDSSKNIEALISAPARTDSKSDRARELILDILESEGEQESDALDARVAQETGLAAGTVRNLRSKLKDEGLSKLRPEKDELGEIKRWLVRRSGAPRL